jgi:DNA N-6-adenine-methyltransferase (Dam)
MLSNLSGEIEWYTPERYLDAARAVMGSIDLDPASSEAAQEHVNAGGYFTAREDGLRQTWHGRVWLNPPYAMPHIRNFVHRICDAAVTGEISEGILLTNSATDTEWCHRAFHDAQAVCFTRGRIRFLEARDRKLVVRPAPVHGQLFFYFGTHVRRFKSEFGEFGQVFTT